MEEVPQDYKTAGIFMLIAGVMNLIASAMVALVWLSTIFLFFVAFLYIIPFCVAICEIVCAIMMLQGKKVPQSMIVSVMGLISAFFMCGMIGMVMEILAIVFTQKPEVREWLEA